jgi:hypothetical protein
MAVVFFCYPLLHLFATSIKERKRDIIVGGHQAELTVRIGPISFIVATTPQVEADEFIAKKQNKKIYETSQD